MTAATQAQIVATAKQALQNNEIVECYGGCARIYIQAGCLLTIDEMMTLTLRKQSSLKRSRQKAMGNALEALAGMGFKLIRGRIYIGYDNNTKKEYSKAVAIVKALESINVFMSVVAEED